MFWKINGLSQNEQSILLKKIDLIKHFLSEDLDVDYTLLKHSSNSIRISKNVDLDNEKDNLLIQSLVGLRPVIDEEDRRYYGLHPKPEIVLYLDYGL